MTSAAIAQAMDFHGKIASVYESPSAGYNTPYGVFPIWQFGSASIGGGELFFSLSRMYDPPLFENAIGLH